jgi:hypothetical protein
MKATFSHLDEFRVRNAPEFASPPGVRWGAFRIPLSGPRGAGGPFFVAIADDGTGGGDASLTTGWEHVSVRVVVDPELGVSRVPTWDEMDRVKRMFWPDEETAMQFHVRQRAEPAGPIGGTRPSAGLHLSRDRRRDGRSMGEALERLAAAGRPGSVSISDVISGRAARRGTGPSNRRKRRRDAPAPASVRGA